MPISCTVPTVGCNASWLEAPMTQRFILMQLLCAAVNGAGGASECGLDALKAASQDWICQGSPSKLRLIQTQMICENLADVDCSQPVCWTPLELEGAITYLTCQLLNALAV